MFWLCLLGDRAGRLGIFYHNSGDGDGIEAGDSGVLNSEFWVPSLVFALAASSLYETLASCIGCVYCCDWESDSEYSMSAVVRWCISSSGNVLFWRSPAERHLSGMTVFSSWDACIEEVVDVLWCFGFSIICIGADASSLGSFSSDAQLHSALLLGFSPPCPREWQWHALILSSLTEIAVQSMLWVDWK